MTDNAKLVERLQAEIQKADDTIDCLRPLHDTEISLSWKELVQENEAFKDLLREAIRALSQQAPVGARTEREWQLLLNSKAVWIDKYWAYFIPLSDAESLVTGKQPTAAQPHRAPVGTAEDEAKLEELLAAVVGHSRNFTLYYTCKDVVPGKAEVEFHDSDLAPHVEALRSFFKQSRAPHPSQAGAEAVDEETVRKAYNLGWHRCAEWANRDDLKCDDESPAYLFDRDADLRQITNALSSKNRTQA